MSDAPESSASAWREATSPEGRKYFYNSVTQKTSWTKPPEMIVVDPAIVDASWKEYDRDGKKYYHNTQTNETVWEMPEAFRAHQVQQQAPPPGPSYVAGGASSYLPSYSQRNNDRDEYQQQDRRFNDRDREDRYGGGGDRERGAASFVPAANGNEPVFSSREEAEAAFMKMLKKAGVQPDWSWPQTIRACICDPNWKAIPDFNGREEAFKKYCSDLRLQEKEKEADRQTKLRSSFMAMLKSHPEIKYYTRWGTALPIIENEAVFRTAKDENERRQLFEEYIATLQKVQAEKEANERTTAVEKITEILETLELEPYTGWKDAQNIIQKNEEYVTFEKESSVHQIDVLTAFERHIRQLQIVFNQKTTEEKRAEKRVERKNRDAFKELLGELKADGKIKSDTVWKDIHNLIEDDPRYQNMLGQEGSSPLDLFWDEIQEQEGVLRGYRHTVLDLLEELRFEIQSKTPFEEFQKVVGKDPRIAEIDDHSLRAVFDALLEKVKVRERRQMDDFRSALKHLEPPILVTDTWDEIRPRAEKLKAFRELDDEDSRITMFEKVIRRLKEKEQEKREKGERDDGEREREKGERSRREVRDRDREHGGERDREYRNGESDRQRRHHTRTHSPEHNDPYAGERRKQEKDREQRNKKREGATGLSPPYRGDRERERDRDPHRERNRERDEYRGSDRRSRQSSGDHFGRDRRERDVERERSYLSRKDPLERSTELDYGDYGESRPIPSRRRRDSDEEARRDTKRARYSPRRERRSRSRSAAVSVKPDVVETKEDDAGLRSGSEEGEIEE